jgi:hypothetical protein
MVFLLYLQDVKSIPHNTIQCVPSSEGYLCIDYHALRCVNKKWVSVTNNKINIIVELPGTPTQLLKLTACLLNPQMRGAHAHAGHPYLTTHDVLASQRVPLLCDDLVVY